MSETTCVCGKEKAFDEEKCPACQERDKRPMEIIKQPEGAVGIKSPAEMITHAISEGVDLDKLEKLLALQERWEANEARKSYATAFSIAQEGILSVVKTKINPQTHSKYADLGDIIESAKPFYTREGFSIIFYEGVPALAGDVRVCADVLHKSGHKETYYYDVPLDGVGIKGNANMTKIHAKASSTQYGRRYLMCMIWNIPTSDDDGNLAGGSIEFITEKQASNLLDLLAMHDLKEESLLKYLKIETLEALPASEYQKAIVAIETQAKKKKEASVK